MGICLAREIAREREREAAFYQAERSRVTREVERKHHNEVRRSRIVKHFGTFFQNMTIEDYLDLSLNCTNGFNSHIVVAEFFATLSDHRQFVWYSYKHKILVCYYPSEPPFPYVHKRDDFAPFQDKRATTYTFHQFYFGGSSINWSADESFVLKKMSKDEYEKYREKRSSLDLTGKVEHVRTRDI